MICFIDTCKGKVVAKGLCDKHRIRLRRHGNPNITLKEYYPTLKSYFYSKMGKLKITNRCIPWQGKSLKSGYGQLRADNKKELAHRMSYKLNIGRIPKGMVICHKCDNPSCVNPKHLFLGNHVDNVRDCIKKGRNKSPPVHLGKNNIKTKLSEYKVKNIRYLYSQNKMNSYELAHKYKVSRQNIMAVIKRITWAHVK